MATMKDIAQRAGVSLITVSRVVNNSGYVGAQTRARVEAAIADLHFVPNRVASSLRSQHSTTLALVLPDITNSFWTSIARGAEDEAWSRGYSLFICNSDNQVAKEAAYIESLIARRVEGVLFVPTPAPESRDQVTRLRQHGLNLVMIHRSLDGVDADIIRSDGETAAFRLTEALIRRGSRRIGFAGLPETDVPTQDRLRGYRQALTRAGLPFDRDLLRFDAGYEGRGGPLVGDLLALPEPPDAILLANSRIAQGGLRAIEAADLSVPDDIAVAAFHDISTLDHYASRLVRAVQPSYTMGQLAARRLFDIRQNGTGAMKEIILESTIHLPDAVPDRTGPNGLS